MIKIMCTTATTVGKNDMVINKPGLFVDCSNVSYLQPIIIRKNLIISHTNAHTTVNV